MLSDDRPLLLPPPPRNLSRQASLFMDFDGTLVEIVERPDAVVVDAALISLLANLRLAFEDRLAIVSGRSRSSIRCSGRLPRRWPCPAAMAMSIAGGA
jgi:trehalose-phosphatase